MKTQKGPEKKRVIVDYKNVTQDILELFTDRYPYGYEDQDIIKFKNAKGENVSAVPFETKDTKYLIKIGVEMDRKIEAFLDDDEDDDVDVESGEAAEIDPAAEEEDED